MNIEEAEFLKDDIKRLGRYISLASAILDAADDELASLSLNAAAEDGAVAATSLVADAHGYIQQAQGVFVSLMNEIESKEAG